jgi:predicted DCC family thiol-disulfide oxidoreductase YuxK
MVKIVGGIVLFDGVCNLCCFLVKFIIKRDLKRRFRFAALQSLTGQQILTNSKQTVSDRNSVVYVRDDKYYYRSSAILKILLDLGGFWKAMYVFIIIPPFIRDYVYAVIAKTRYRIFGKRSACLVPTIEIQDRFLV